MSWIAGLLALVCGAMLGVLFTIAHRAQSTIGGVEVPTGFVLGIVAVTCLLIGLRLLSPDRFATVGAALGIVGSIVVLASRNDSGSVLIADGAFGVAWLIFPAVIAAVVIVWPARRPRRAAAG